MICRQVLESALAFSALLALLLAPGGCEGRPSSPGSPSAAGSAPPFSPVPTFADVAEEAGVRFTNVCGGPDKDYIIETNGAGCSLFDYDGDGDLDIFLVNGARLPPPYGAPPPPGPPPSDALLRNPGGMR